MRALLSTLWIFVMLNYLYADVISLMDPALGPLWRTGELNGLHLSPAFLFGAGVMMEVPIAMTLLSRLLPWRANRIANIAAAIFKTAAVLGSFAVGTPSGYYLFFASIELPCTIAIAVLAWRWREVTLPESPGVPGTPA